MNKLLVSASVALGATSLSFAQQTEKPNFLLFIADDCSHYDLGCYGSVDSKTPNIDHFATQGVRFTQAYQAVPMSSPTRHNLYTCLLYTSMLFSLILVAILLPCRRLLFISTSSNT